MNIEHHIKFANYTGLESHSSPLKWMQCFKWHNKKRQKKKIYNYFNWQWSNMINWQSNHSKSVHLKSLIPDATKKAFPFSITYDYKNHKLFVAQFYSSLSRTLYRNHSHLKPFTRINKYTPKLGRRLGPKWGTEANLFSQLTDAFISQILASTSVVLDYDLAALVC